MTMTRTETMTTTVTLLIAAVPVWQVFVALKEMAVNLATPAHWARTPINAVPRSLQVNISSLSNIGLGFRLCNISIPLILYLILSYLILSSSLINQAPLVQLDQLVPLAAREVQVDATYAPLPHLQNPSVAPYLTTYPYPYFYLSTRCIHFYRRRDWQNRGDGSYRVYW